MKKNITTLKQNIFTININNQNNNLIGGRNNASRNLIAGGISIKNSKNNIIKNNYIGSDFTGMNSSGANQHGIFLEDSTEFTIICTILTFCWVLNCIIVHLYCKQRKYMKIVLEDIKRLAGSSFRILVNPKLNNFYYWHFHPEFELTFIEAPQGTRRVGNHVGQFEGSDLVFIGSNIPHLNFDYGIRTEYEKVVLQINADFFKNDFASTPELKAIHQLFENSKKVILYLNKILTFTPKNV